MNYQQFVIAIKERVAHSLGNGMSIEIHTALKNNGNERVGLTISDKQINLSPTIYLEEYYKYFEDGDSLDDIAESVMDVYHEVKFEHSWQVHTIMDFDVIKEKIVFKLINASKNEILLQTLPYVPYLDFAIVFYILFDVDETGTATIPITNELIKLWNTNLDKIHKIARKNTPRILPSSFKPMRVVIEELLGNICEIEVQEDDIMFVLTNSLRSLGAACILYEGVLEQIGKELKENYYILPSSIHEVIIVPESRSPEKDDLNEMVKEINETQVDVEEVLSDHVYYYDCVTKVLG